MILDKELQFSDSQAVTSTGSNASTNSVDMGHSGNWAAGKQLYLHILVKETVTSGGAATVDFQLQGDDNSSFSSPANAITSGAIAKATLVEGHVISLPIPMQPAANIQRYNRVNYEVATAALTGGKFSSWISDQPQTN